MTTETHTMRLVAHIGILVGVAVALHQKGLLRKVAE